MSCRKRPDGRRAVSRREFLTAAAGAGAGVALFTIVPRHVLGGRGHTSANEKLNIAGIGIGGMGAVNLKALETENIVALCDADHAYAAPIFERYPQAKVYRDYRELLDKQKDVDAVVIATPDHTHAVITLAAMQAGKHVYCQKPLTHDIAEARFIAKAAERYRVATQMGIQGHSDEGIRLIAEWLAAGAIGTVREVDAWCNLSYAPHGHEWWSSPCADRPKDTPPVPDTLDWDLFIGPAAYRPYHPCYHPKVWRCWWDFGVGMMGDRGVHTFDPIVWPLKLGQPQAVEALMVKGGNAEVHPDQVTIEFHFAGREGRPPVKVTWYDGHDAPRPEELEADRRLGDGEGGVIFKGEKGKIMCGTYGNSPRLIPESRMAEFQRPEKTLPRIADGHEQDWVRACKAGAHAGSPPEVQAGANFTYAARVTETVLLGNIAKRFPQRRLEWDEQNARFSNAPEADPYVQTPYRAGWKLT